MLTSIDESGPFSTRSAGTSVDCVGAVVVPERDAQALFAAFGAMTLPRSKDGEVKGRSLAPTDIEAVTVLLERFPDVLVFVEGIDMSVATAARVAEFQRDQADSIGRSAPDDASDFVKTKIVRLRREVAALSLPLFVEFILLTELVDSVLRWASVYYSLRVPAELGRFGWRIDPKEPSQRTRYERLWMEMVREFLQMRSLRQPLATADVGDYAAMERFAARVMRKPDGKLPISVLTKDALTELEKAPRGWTALAHEVVVHGRTPIEGALSPRPGHADRPAR